MRTFRAALHPPHSSFFFFDLTSRRKPRAPPTGGGARNMGGDAEQKRAGQKRGTKAARFQAKKISSRTGAAAARRAAARPPAPPLSCGAAPTPHCWGLWLFSFGAYAGQHHRHGRQAPPGRTGRPQSGQAKKTRANTRYCCGVSRRLRSTARRTGAPAAATPTE